MAEGEKSSYRAFVGPESKYDLMSAMQFIRLFQLGLREDSTLLEVGAGSLRAARLFIPFLLPGKYFAIEPEKWLVEEGLRNEVGYDVLKIKRPQFVFNQNFDFTDLELPESGVDYCIAQSIFSHTSIEQMTLGFESISSVLDGLFLATYMKGDTDYLGKKWVYPGCVTFTKETFERTANRYGLLVKELKWAHPNHQTWVVMSKDQSTLDALRESDEPLIEQYVSNIQELTARLNRIEAFFPVKVFRKIRRGIAYVSKKLRK